MNTMASAALLVSDPAHEFEPFALDLWREEIVKWLPAWCTTRARKRLFFGGLYQLVVATAEKSADRDVVSISARLL